MEKTRYAIQVIGYGARTRYTLRKCFWFGSNPVPGTGVYKTLEDAQQAAQAAGIKIEAIGDCYEISSGLM